MVTYQDTNIIPYVAFVPFFNEMELLKAVFNSLLNTLFDYVCYLVHKQLIMNISSRKNY